MAPIADAGVAAAAALYCELRREGAPILLVDAVCDVAGPGRAHEVRHAVARVNEALGGSPRIVRAEELARRYGPVILADARVDGGRSALDLAAGLARLFHERARASARSFQPAVIAAVAAVVTLREAGVGSDERERRDMAAGAFGVSTRAVRGAAKALVTLGALPPSTASRP